MAKAVPFKFEKYIKKVFSKFDNKKQEQIIYSCKFLMVEMRRVELLSENTSKGTSPSAAYCDLFPNTINNKQIHVLGSF